MLTSANTAKINLSRKVGLESVLWDKATIGLNETAVARSAYSRWSAVLARVFGEADGKAVFRHRNEFAAGQRMISGR